MSLILDALKRAEREHPRDLAQRVGATAPRLGRRRARAWPVVLLTAAALAAAAAGWWWLARAPGPAEPAAAQAVAAQPVVDAPRVQPPRRSALDDVDIASGRGASGSGAPFLHQLPESARSGIPRITLDAHIWSEDPARRFVFINMRRYGEGETVAEGLRLLRVLPEGAELEWRGQRFRISTR